jgi:hypothetical protein
MMSFLGISFNILPVIRSYPEAFLGLRYSCIILRISFGVRNLIGYVICSGSFGALLISVSTSSFCGSSFSLNVFSKCPAKVFPFSLSLQSKVWSALLISGIVVSVVLMVWFLSRVNCRGQLSLLSSEGVPRKLLL